MKLAEAQGLCRAVAAFLTHTGHQRPQVRGGGGFGQGWGRGHGCVGVGVSVWEGAC